LVLEVVRVEEELNFKEIRQQTVGFHTKCHNCNTSDLRLEEKIYILCRRSGHRGWEFWEFIGL